MSANEDNNRICPLTWSRAIILLDMNAFFASIEQLDFDSLRGKPVAVTNGLRGSCVITSSYEARAYGVKTGMRFPEAKRLCPELIQRSARPERYAELSKKIMAELYRISPDMEVFSVDEAFLDVTHCQKLFGTPARIGRLAYEAVFNATQLPCSVGVSGDKTTAKYAAKLQKPKGFTVIAPWDAARVLAPVPVTELCGINKGVANYLAQYGAYTCQDVAALPMGVLAKRYGNVGKRLWYMCRGEDPDPIHTGVAAPKSMGHGKVMPPNTTDPEVVLTYLLQLSEKLGARLRQNHLAAQHFFIGLRSRQWGWLSDKGKLVAPTNDGALIFKLGRAVLRRCWQEEAVWQIQVTALDPRPECGQLDFFLEPIIEPSGLNRVMDTVNQRYGEFTLAPARLLNRSSMPNVISPAWKPDGHRQTIPKSRS